MQITKLGNNKSISNNNKTKKFDGPSFSSHLSQTESPEATNSTSNISGIMPVDSLLALQEVDNNQSGSQKYLKQGFNMVEQLDNIRIGLLEGRISESVLNSLNEQINNWRKEDTDDQLKELIDEIELRAAVELAKLEAR